MSHRSEAEYTRPRPDCPSPERWTAADAYSAEIEVTELVAAFVRALQPDYVVETGTCWGQTAEAIGRALASNGQGRLVSLEIDEAKVQHSRQRCHDLPVEVRHMSSLEFTPGEPIGLAWFDSLLQLRLPEFNRYLPSMTGRTIVGFHDTGPHFGTFADEIAAHPRVRCMRMRTPRGVTFAEVIK